jgi:multiple sugar transport system substrate-binding protein
MIVLPRVVHAVVAAVTMLLLAACSGREPAGVGAGEKVVRLWVAPNPAEERFWTRAVGRWNQQHLGTRVEFTTIPATGGSEEAILTALVSGSGPDISANIFPGFAAQLANLGQLQDIEAMPGFARMVEKRQLAPMLESLRMAGHQYLLPLYFSPNLIWWRTDILAGLGIKKIPRTFEDVYEVSRRRAERGAGMTMQVLTGREWRSRWYDYVSYYFAGSGGAPYIKDRRAQYESQASLEALNFIRTMFQNGWTGLDFDADDPLPKGLVVGASHGAWDLSDYQMNHPETLRYIAIGPMLRSARAEQESGGDRAHTFADCKGMVLFKSSKVQVEALAFMAWVASDDELSLLWFQETGMPPARGDLMSNRLFADFYRKNPLAAQYTAYVDVGQPSIPLEETIDVNKLMNVLMIEPILFNGKPVEQAAAEASRSTNRLLERTR